MSEMSRRDFINRTAATVASVGLGVTAAGETLAGFSSGDVAPRTPDADVIIIGGGLAGMAGAITAADDGATVILIDKRYAIGGTAMGAGGSFSAAGTKMQQAKNIQDSPEAHFRDADAIGKGKADPALLKLYTEHAPATMDWLMSLGIEFDPKGPRLAFEHELYSVPRTYDATGGGPGYIAVLRRQLMQRVDAGKVRLRTETSARQLLADRGRIVGVRVVDDAGVPGTLHGKAVILACGGYGSNRAMLRRYNPTLAEAVTVASKYATGDGIRMAEAAGAKLVNMDLLVPYFAGVENPPGSNRTMMISLLSGILSAFKGDVWVAPDGKRFMNEDTPSPDERERALRRLPNAHLFTIFDDAILKANKPPLFNWDGLVQEGRVVKQARSIGALAIEIGVPPQALVETIERYNGHVDSGRDADFGRKDLVRIQVPPFYGVVASGVIFMTAGGVQTNATLQAVDARGHVIPGLYAAGEVMGAAQWMGDGLMGDAGNGDSSQHTEEKR